MLTIYLRQEVSPQLVGSLSSLLSSLEDDHLRASSDNGVPYQQLHADGEWVLTTPNRVRPLEPQINMTISTYTICYFSYI